MFPSRKNAQFLLHLVLAGCLLGAFTPVHGQSVAKAIPASDSVPSGQHSKALLLTEDTSGAVMRVAAEVWPASMPLMDTAPLPLDKDELYAHRLDCMPSYFDLTYNPQVRKMIDFFGGPKKALLERSAAKAMLYFPLFDEVFESYGIPPRMKYLAVIESGLRPEATSRAGAAGVWQFMPRTARLFKLHVDGYYDERRDVFRSTEAAAIMLNSLYDMYQDWFLALAAYNYGPGNINRAIKRSGLQQPTYWELQPFLPRETRNYVPSFIAVNYLLTHAKDHGIETAPIDPHHYPLSKDEVEPIALKGEKLSLSQLSAYLDLPEEELLYLNPALKYKILPGWPVDYQVNIPCDRYTCFYEQKDSILAGMHVKNVPYEMTHRVRRGECLSVIASRYGCRVSELRAWNNLRNNNLRVGQKLVLYSHKKKQAQPATAKAAKAPAKPTTTSPVTTTSGRYVRYTIRSGDTLYDIAKQYPGVSANNILQFNGITNARSLKPGVVIKIPT